ncbi:MAG: rod shape-determining protein RodA [Deltaproteobacteria bacterium]|nr:rod shape-determining protein RodA [Deltaproteobacteria bacterium]
MQLKLFTVKKRVFGHFPWALFFALLLWLTIGLVNLYSATYRVNDPGMAPLFKSQLLWVALGLVLLFLVTLIDYHFLEEWAYPLYALSLVLLGLVFVAGRSVAGQQNWVVLGGISFQPSEIAKLCFIFALSKFYSSHSTQKKYHLKNLIQPLLLLLPPILLVILQKDLGGSLFFILLFSTLTFFMKIPLKYFVVAGLVSAVMAVGAYHFVLKPYQKDRVRVFLNPEKDAKGKGYHLVQSKIAVGSGEWFGKGYLKGTINKLKYLPERHTDFIFPVLAEEWGLLGAGVTLLIMAFFILSGLESASHTKEPFGALLSLGVIALFFWHIVINLGGVLGLMPLTGVPLPLLSYGGSSILTMLVAVGILFNVRMRRFTF